MKTWSTPVRQEKNAVIPCRVCGRSFFKPAFDCEGFGFTRCAECGLVQRNPQPLKEEIIARYSSAFGEDYLSYELENETSFLRLQKLALKDAGFFKIDKAIFRAAGEGKPSALDIGCATGALPAFLRDRGWRVTGVEISPGAEYARNVRFLDVRSLPLEENSFPDKSFDVVLASHLIEHLNDPYSFLTETYRILKDDGFAFITTPNISGFQARIMGGKWRSAIFDHLYLFSVRTLSALLKKSCFKVEKISTWGGLASGLTLPWIKKTADLLAKRFAFGDVMIIRARKRTSALLL